MISSIGSSNGWHGDTEDSLLDGLWQGFNQIVPKKLKNTEENSISQDLDAPQINDPDEGHLRKKPKNDKLVTILGVIVFLLSIAVMVMAFKIS